MSAGGSPGYYLRVRGQVTGPYNMRDLKMMRDRGQVARYHELSADSRTWHKAEAFVELFLPPVARPVSDIGPVSAAVPMATALADSAPGNVASASSPGLSLEGAEPGHAVQPAFPRTVLSAAIFWMFFGGHSLLVAAGLVAEAGATLSSGLYSGLFRALLGTAFLFEGIRSLRGAAADTKGNAIGSIVVSLVFVAAGVQGGIRGDAIGVSLINLLIGAGLLAAGCLALLGRNRYRAWRLQARSP